MAEPDDPVWGENMSEISFLDRCLAGDVADPAEEIYDAIQAWHQVGGREKDSDRGGLNVRFDGAEVSLHRWLGMTWEEYDRWVRDSKVLGDILAERKLSKELHETFEGLVQAVASKFSSTDLLTMAWQALPWLGPQDAARLTMVITTLLSLIGFISDGTLSPAEADILRDRIIAYVRALSAKAEVQKAKCAT